MPAAASFLRCSAPGVVVAVLKRAELGEAIVVRAHETHGVATDARFEFPRWGIGWTAALGPGQLMTWRIEPDGSLRETDLLEGLEAEPA
jgi:hypothetical protein